MERAYEGDLMLLNTESREEYEKMVREFLDDIQPEGIIERQYAKDVAYHTWEIRRYRTAKAEIINLTMFTALRTILYTHFERRGTKHLDILARGWFDDKKTKATVLKMLGNFGLDEAAVTAKALKLRAPATEELNRLEAHAEAGREKALRMIVKLKKEFGQRLRRRSDAFLAVESQPALGPLQ